MSETTEWYYLVGEEQIGPVAGEYLQQLAAAGTILPETQLWAEGLEEWIPASTVEGLCPAPRHPKLVVGAAAQAAHPLAGEIIAPQQAVAQPGYPAQQAPQAAYPVQQQAQQAYVPQQAQQAYAPQQVQPGYPAQQPAPGYPAQHAALVYPGQTAIPGEDYPSPGLMKASYGWFIALPVLPIFAIIAGSFMIAARLKNLAISGSATSATTFQVMTELGFFFFGSIILILLCSLLFFIMKLIVLYRAWASLKLGGARTTPGTAVGYLFIPFFNFYWIFIAFVGLAKDWNRIRLSHPNLAGGPKLSEGLALSYCIMFLVSILLGMIAPLIDGEDGGIGSLLYLLALVTVFILELIYLYGICRLVNFMGRLHMAQTALPSVGLRLY